MRYIVLLSISLSLALSITGDNIADQISNSKTPKDMKSDMIMEIIDTKGRIKNKRIRSVSKDKSKMQILWFVEPRRDNGISLLKIDHSDKPDEMRMWIPAIRKIRRISSNKRTGSFMGSDLSYEDLYNKDKSDFTYNFIKEELVDTTECYIIEIIPKEHISTSYSKHVSWISKADFTTIKEDSYNKSGKVCKKKIFSYILIDSYSVISSITVRNTIKGSSTSLLFENIVVNSDVNDELFSEKNLKRIIY